MPGWKNSDRRSQLPPDWSKRREQRLAIDNHQCTARILVDGRWGRCPEPATDVDHPSNRHDHAVENLRSLCAWHHQKKSSAEGARARNKILAENRNRFSRTEAHPYG